MNVNDFKKYYKVDDEYYTPPNAVKVIMPYLTKFKNIWCPFDTKESYYTKLLNWEGYNVTNTHICQGEDFFKTPIPERCECIVSNPPYSRKKEVIKRLCELGKPFAMLLNASGVFDNKVMFEIAKQYQLEIMYIYPRISFIHNGEITKGTMFQSCYLCKGVLPNNLMFEHYDRNNDWSDNE